MPIGEALAERIRRPLRRRARERMAADLFRDAAVARDDGHDPRRSRAARHPARRVRLRSRTAGGGQARGGRSVAARSTISSTTACSKRPRARRSRTGSRSSCRCSARPGSATTRTARSGSRTAAGPISAPTSPITCRRRENADELIDIWGADHAGTVKRIKAAVAALTEGEGEPIPFDVKLVQMVQLLRGGEPVKMSKRSGNFVTIADMVERSRQGRRALHHADPQARSADGLRLRQGGRGIEGQPGLLRPICPCADPLDAAQGGGRGAGAVRRRISTCWARTNWRWSSWRRSSRAMVEAAAQAREPHRIAFYLYDLAAAFHAFWNLGNDDPAKRIIVAQDAGADRREAFPRRANRAGYSQRPWLLGRRGGRGALRHESSGWRERTERHRGCRIRGRPTRPRNSLLSPTKTIAALARSRRRVRGTGRSTRD